MELIEFYNVINGDYKGTLDRLSDDRRITKYLLKTLENDDFDVYIESFNKQDYKEAFRRIHNIKGIALNLGLTKLSTISSAICEEIRYGEPNKDLSSMIETLTVEYNFVVENIKKLN